VSRCTNDKLDVEIKRVAVISLYAVSAKTNKYQTIRRNVTTLMRLINPGRGKTET
jgi:hypothetical protein